MECARTYFSAHAVQRMFERSIRKPEVMNVIANGRIIQAYPEDTPYPSLLLLGWRSGIPLHVVVGVDHDVKTCHIITVYVPDVEQWNDDYQTRRIR